MIDTGGQLERAKKYERQGRSEEAAAAYAGVADAFEAQGDWPSAIAVRARHARALAAAGRGNEAVQVLARADHAAGSLPREAADARAVLDGQAAYVLEGAGRTADAARRAWAAMVAFRQLHDNGRADRAAVHAAKLIVKDASPGDALQPLHELMTHMPPGGEAHRQVAAILAEVQRRPDRDYDILVTDPDSAAWGRLAAALAVGAHLAVGNGAAWNSLTHDEDPGDNRTLLERDWGVTDNDSWQKQMDALLKADNSDPAIQAVLDRRDQRTPDHHAWQVAIADWCREKDISTKTINALLDLSGEILQYEARFRADGLLAPDGLVESVYGYDFGRAVNMARWGLNAGYCDREAAEDCVLRAGHYAHQVYKSWDGFSAGYILGRMLRFDDGEFGEWYDRSLTGHRILTEDPASPWHRMAWG